MAVAITRYSRFGENLGRLHLLDAKHVEGIDGTDELTVTCYEDLEKGDYLVWMDQRGLWHEHIVDEPERGHDEVGRPTTTAACINSINETWDDWVTDRRPSGTAQTALTSILAGTRWTPGTCKEGTASHTFYHKSVRECIQEVLEVWGGELETTITCGASGVTGRSVAVVAARGNQHSAKRFTWSKDLVNIRRRVGSANPKTRIYAYGRGEEIEETGGFGRRIGIDSVNGGIPYVEDATLHAVWGHLGPNGTILPSVGVFIDENCDDPATLKDEALAYLDTAKEPQVTYEAEVIDLAAFGRDWEGVSLGDLVAIIDTEFSDDGLRLRGRVSRLERDLLTNDANVTFGTLVDALAGPWSDVQARLASLSNKASNWDQIVAPTPSWLDELISSLNAAYNSAGTYHFSSFEKGEIWASVPLDENGRATRAGGWAMNISGGGFRLASELDSDGEWLWRTFGNGKGFTADELNAGQINADLITAGTLSGGGLEIDLDTGTATVGDDVGIGVGGRTVADVLADVDATISNVDVQYAQNQSATVAPTSGWSTTAPAWQAGYYIWQRTATTTPSGTSYSTPVMISGRDGVDGSSVSILGSYNTYAELIAAHPTGSVGDGYLVAGDLYVWDGTQWEDVGTIQGPPGTNGTNGTNGADGSQIWTATENPTTPNYTFNISDLTGPTGITPRVGDIVVRSYYRYTITSVGTTTVLTGTRTSIRGTPGTAGRGISSTTVTYGTSASATTEPTTWQSTVPALSQGAWLWVKTTYAYSDSTTSESVTKTYIGTDGEDGASVYVQSATKSDGTTTVVIADTAGRTSTLTIDDGEDGQNGLPGQNGLSGFVHTAWANSADGTVDFSTSVSEGKAYLGVYTDNVQADSNDPSDYSWSLIKGEGIESIVEQYYLSTSDQTPTGGTWSNTQPAWSSGHYIWTRSLVTWEDGTSGTTDPVLAQALNQANEGVAEQNAIVRPYGDGVLVCRTGKHYGMLVDADGSLKLCWVQWSIVDGRLVPEATTTYATIGIHEDDPDYPIAYTFGNRTLGTNVGARSMAEGANVTASGNYSHAEGGNTIASGTCAHAEGNHTDASGNYSHAEGYGMMSIGATPHTQLYTEASGDYSHAEGAITRASGNYSHAEGGPLTKLDDQNVMYYDRTEASGGYSHAEGVAAKASGLASHAEGRDTEASGNYSHAEGSTTTAGGISSHSEGWNTTAGGDYSHAEGGSTDASGNYSHTEGYNTEASGLHSHAGGEGTIAASANQTAIGKYNEEDTQAKYPFIIGNGSDSSNRSNAFAVDWDGNVTPAGFVRQTAATYTFDDRTDSTTGWLPALTPTLESSVGNPSKYLEQLTNKFTAKRDCVVKVSAQMNWRGAVTGQFGVDFYDGSTERSVFVGKPSSSDHWVSVVYPPRIFVLSQGDKLEIRRYSVSGASYRGTRSWATIEVIG